LRTAISADHLVKAFPGFATFTLREIDGGLHSGEISLPANARADLGTLVAAIVQAHQKGHDERRGRLPDAFYEDSQHTCALDAASPNTSTPDGDSWATKVRKGRNAPRGRGHSSQSPRGLGQRGRSKGSHTRKQPPSSTSSGSRSHTASHPPSKRSNRTASNGSASSSSGRNKKAAKASASSSKKPAPRKREGRDAASDEHSDVPSGGHARSRRSRHHRGSGSDGDSSEKSNTIRSYHSGSEDGGSVSSSHTSASSTRPDRSGSGSTKG
ncbi:unnamed protein product, partial [Pylaiella littoralis]